MLIGLEESTTQFRQSLQKLVLFFDVRLPDESVDAVRWLCRLSDHGQHTYCIFGLGVLEDLAHRHDLHGLVLVLVLVLGLALGLALGLVQDLVLDCWYSLLIVVETLVML